MSIETSNSGSANSHTTAPLHTAAPLQLDQLPLMCEVEAVQQLLQSYDFNSDPSKLVIVDLGKPERFVEGHLPHAQQLSPSETLSPAPVPGYLPEASALKSVFARLGIEKDSTVLVYDDEGGGWAGRFIWILDELGYRNYSYINGGYTAWKEEGFELQTGESHLNNGTLNGDFSGSGEHTISLEALLKAIETNQITVWDARSEGEHQGTKANAKRGGRIPNARHYEWTDAMDKSKALRLKPLEQLRQELKSVGIDGTQPIATHCQSHHRSGLTYLIGKLLDFDIKAYSGSWAEWGNRDDTPIDVG